jgi:glycine/D-amino acid oxidase-like deaminating enzyme
MPASSAPVRLTGGTSFSDLGSKTRVRFYRAQQEGVALVEHLLDVEGIEAERTGQGGIALAHRATAVVELADAAAFLGDTFGAKHRLLDRSALAARGMRGPHFHGGLAEDTGFGLNPGKYLASLAAAAVRRGARIFHRSPATGWRREGQVHRLTTPSGSVRARAVLIATEGYTPEDLLPRLQGLLLPVLSIILLTRPLTATETAATGWSDTTPAYDLCNLHNYFRLLPNGRFLFGGRAGHSARPAALARCARSLETVFRRYFPAWRNVEITHRWSGFICIAADRLPHVGSWPEEPGLHFALGYARSGIPMASWAGQAIAAVIGGTARDRGPLLFRRPPPRFPLGARMLCQRYFYGKCALDDLLRR